MKSFRTFMCVISLLGSFQLMGQSEIETKATVIFVRPYSPVASSSLFTAIVNDSTVIKMVNNSYYPLLVDSGVIEFKPKGKSYSGTLEVEAGKVYYVMARFLYGAWKPKPDLIVISNENGKSLMTNYSPKDLRKPLLRHVSRVGVSVGFGPGFNDVPIIKTTEGQDVKIGFGGGGGFGIHVGTEINKYFDMQVGYRFVSRGLTPHLQNASITFTRNVVSITPSLIIPIEGGYAQRIKLGAGADFYFGNKLEHETAKISGGFNEVWKYKESAGVHAQLLYEVNFSDRISTHLGVRYYHVKYQYKSSPVRYPTSPDFATPNGAGLDLLMGISFHF